MTNQSHEYRVPLAVTEKLELVRARAWKVRLATAIVGGLVVLLGAMGVSMAIDRWATLYSPTWRSMLTLSALSATGVTLMMWIVAAWRYVNRVDRVAADVDRSMPDLEERWSTLAQLNTPEKTRDVHPAMYRQVAEEANTSSPRIDPPTVVRLTGFTRAAWCLTAVAAILVGAAIMDSHRTAVLFKRFWLPMANISATEINNLSEHKVVARGESLEIAAELSGSPVKQATLFLNPEGEDEQTITLVPRGDEQNHLAHRVRTVKEPLRYRLRAGDGQTEWQEVAVADRPELAAATLKVISPEYTQLKPQEFDKLPRRLSALTGSVLQFAFKPRQPVAEMHLDLSDGKKQQLMMDADGWYRWEIKLAENFSLSPILAEEHGLTNRRPPQCSVQARPDKPPVVRIITPNDEIAVRPDEKVPVTFEAKDDVRIGSAELVVYDEGKAGAAPRILDTIPIPLGDQEGAKEVKATVDLDLSRYKMLDGTELSFAVRVREDRSLAPIVMPQQQPAPQQLPNEQTLDLVAGSVDPASNAPTIQELVESEGAQSKPTEQKALENLTNATAQNVAEYPSSMTEQPADNDVVAANPSEAAISAAAKPQAENASQPVADPVKIADSAPTEPAAAPSEPSAMTKAIADALPDAVKDLAQGAPQVGAPAGNQAPSNSDNAQNSANKETTSDRQSLNTANSPSALPQPGETASENQREQMAASQPSSNQSHPGQPQTGQPQSSVPQASSPNDAMANQSQPQNGSPQAGSQGGQAKQQTPDEQNPSDPMTPEQMAAEQENGSQPNTNSSQANQENKSQPQMAGGSTPPSQNRPMNQLDVQPNSQSSTSNRMRLKIDEWAGSFAGQERAELEMIIAPELDKLDELLEKAETLARNVLDTVDSGSEWQDAFGRDVDSAGQQVAKCMEIVESLEQRSHGTPYAFIGLQLVNISKAHMQPARREYWKALQTDAESRVVATRDGWQHTVRAREMLIELTTKFETTRKEYALAESIEKVKKMYQVFVENSMAMLNPDGDENSPYRRKRVEFDVDEEYLARLKEVIEMRNKMRAELARILADDPRLLRRFLDSQQNRRRILRHELEEIIETQGELNREVLAWTEADEASKPALQNTLLQRHAESAADLAVDAVVLQDHFDTWLPLTQEINNADVQTAAQLLQDVATATEELSSDADLYIAQNQRPELKEPSEPVATEGEVPAPVEAPSTEGDITADDLAADAEALHNQMTNLEVALRQLGTQEGRGDLSIFAANRLVETRDMITRSAEWIRQLKHHQAGKYPNAAEVDQYRLAMQTDELAGKLANLEQQMAGLLQRADNKIPEDIALKSRELLAALDEQAAPNQLSAVYSLRRNQLPRAVERQDSALKGIQQAAKNYDEMVELAIKELDKLPVQDPIASLLEDPTLDELLAGLEQEFAIEELLGIPSRPSNLQVAGDMMQMGGDNSVATAANRRMMMNQIRQQQRSRMRRMDRAVRRAVDRALQETPETAEEEQLELARETVDWNVLVSQLGDDLQQGADKAPPERYRRAIEQYFRQISRPDKDAGTRN
jgi:hypothetical protein